MMRHFIYITIALAAFAELDPAGALGRGFGGAHAGGGLPGGGFGGGGGGGFHGGNFGGGGMSAFHPTGFAGGVPGGGFHPQGNFSGGMAGNRPGGFGGGEMAAQGGFHAGNGLAGFHDYGGVRPGGIVGSRTPEFAAGAELPSAPAIQRTGGYDPVGIGSGNAADRPIANADAGSQLDRFAAMSVGGAGTVADFASDHVIEPVKMDRDTARDFDVDTKQVSDAISHGELPRYISLPTDIGTSLLKADDIQHPTPTARSAEPGVANKAAAQSLASARTTPTANRAEARTAQRWFDDHPVFTTNWLRNNRQALAWVPYLSGYDDWDNAFWESVAWSTVGSWLSVPSNTTPQTYDYGQDVVYNNGNVYVNSQQVGNAAQFFSQAQALAVAGAAQDASNTPAKQSDAKTEWLPLGVYALMHSDKDKPGMIFQLALNKQGLVRGNYFNDTEPKTQPVSGSVDIKTQRVAWQVGNNNKVIVETSLDNLTKDESSALVHLGPDRQERYVLVRLKATDADDKPKK